MVSPFFSVIVPVHNGAHVVQRAIDSVLVQSEGDLEVLAVDDGSTDGTSETLTAVSDPRVRVVTQPASGTPAGARNAGIERAGGRFLAFLDADDTWKPEKLAQVRAHLELDPRIDLVCHGVDLLRDGAVVGRRAYTLSGTEPFYQQLLYRGNFLTTSATVVRASSVRAIGGFDPGRELRIGEDLDLWVRLAQAGARPLLLPEILGTYTVGTGVSQDPGISFVSSFRVLDAHYEALAEAGQLDVKRALWRRARATLALAREHGRSGSLGTAVTDLLSLPADLASRSARYRRLGGNA